MANEPKKTERMTTEGTKVFLDGKLFAECPSKEASDAIFGAFTYLGYSGAEYGREHDDMISEPFF